MAWARDLTTEEERFLTTLGGVIMFWNHIEGFMKVLVQRATVLASMEERIMVLVASLGNVALSDALRALADDHEEERADHLRHCANLFDAERTYRNYFVHNPTTFLTRGDETKGFATHMTARGGKLRVHRGQITREDLERFHDRLSLLQNYVGELIQDSIDLRGGNGLSSLEKPPLPPKLDLDRLPVIERLSLKSSES